MNHLEATSVEAGVPAEVTTEIGENMRMEKTRESAEIKEAEVETGGEVEAEREITKGDRLGVHNFTAAFFTCGLNICFLSY